MRNKIISLADEMLQNVNVKCGYVFVQNEKEIYKKSISAIDAYMKAYDMSKNGNVECYMAALGKNNKAALPIFTVIDGITTLMGQVIE